MKTLIIYFSLTENTKWLAKQIGNKITETSYHRIQLKTNKIKTGKAAIFWYGMRTAFGWSMQIKEDDLDLEQYDQIILGSPIWVSTIPPPVKAFLKRHKLKGKSIAVFCTSGSGSGVRFFKELKEASQVANFSAKLSLIEPFNKMESVNDIKIDAFVNALNPVLFN